MNENAQIRTWARANGWPELTERGRIPADARAAWQAAQDAIPDEDLGDIALPGEDDDLGDLGDLGFTLPAGPAEPEPIPPDEPPGKITTARTRGKPARKPAAAVRADIGAKIGLMLEVPGRVWQARDPMCGGAFVAQRPAISGALTELVLQSPDLIEWFMGAGGGFMLWLNLMAACAPVAQTVWAHHVVHSIEPPPADAQQADYARYAA